MLSSHFPPILPGILMHKNKLQEYTQIAGLPDPAYETYNEGYQHAPKYRARVVVDGVGYTSSDLTLHHRKIDAEQEVAKYALECIAKKENEIGQMIIERDPLILQGSLLCKSILHEFATKTNRNKPTYITNLGRGPGPAYVSSMVFDDQTYFGSSDGNFLRKIVESKGKICSTPHCTPDSSSYKECLPTAFQPGSSGDHSEQPRNAPVAISCIEKKILPKPFAQETCSKQLATIPVRDQIFEKKTFPSAFKPGPGNSSQQRRNVWVKNQGCDKKMLPKRFRPENSSLQPRNTVGEAVLPSSGRMICPNAGNIRKPENSSLQPRNTVGEAVLPSSGRMIRPNAENIRKPENREMAPLKKSRHEYTIGFI